MSRGCSVLVVVGGGAPKKMWELLFTSLFGGDSAAQPPIGLPETIPLCFNASRRLGAYEHREAF